MKLFDFFESRDMCNVCGQTPCNCTHLNEGVSEGLDDDDTNDYYAGYYADLLSQIQNMSVTDLVDTKLGIKRALENGELRLVDLKSEIRALDREIIRTKQGVEEGSTQKDMTGQTCEKCKKGKYQETSIHDDMDGVLHCTKCGTKVDRWRAYKEPSTRARSRQATRDFNRSKSQGVAEGYDDEEHPIRDDGNEGRLGKQYQCPRCHSTDIKTYSDGEKECHQCHKTWDVKGVAEGKIHVGYRNSSGDWIKTTTHDNYRDAKAAMERLVKAGKKGVQHRYDNKGNIDPGAMMTARPDSGVAEDTITESPTIDFIRGLISEFNKQMSGSPYYPMDYKNPGMRMWTRGDGSRYKDPGYIFIDRDLKPEDQPKWHKAKAVEKFWKFLESKGARKIGDVSGEFGSDPHSPAVVLNKLIFVFNGRSIAWGSTSRLKNSSVWRQKQSMAEQRIGPVTPVLSTQPTRTYPPQQVYVPPSGQRTPPKPPTSGGGGPKPAAILDIQNIPISETISGLDLADAIFKALNQIEGDVVRQFGHEVVGDAIMDVVDKYGEIGSMSDLDLAVQDVLERLQRTNNSISESRRYFKISGTSAGELRNKFGLRKDNNGWFLSESNQNFKKLYLEATRTFTEYDLSKHTVSAATIGDDNFVSPVGSVPRGQQRVKKVKKNG